MKKKLAAAGVLAAGVALTGLAGSAYAQDGTQSAKPVGPKGHGGIVTACVTTKVGLDKGKISIKKPGKVSVPGEPQLRVRTGGRAVPAPGGKLTKDNSDTKLTKDTVKSLLRTGGDVPKLGPLPKGVHCTVVKPGTPPAR